MRVTLRAPAYTQRGYSPDSPGHVWWAHTQPYEPRYTDKGHWVKAEVEPSLQHGENMIRAVKARDSEREPRAVRAHLFAHRYARGDKKETKKNKITYHGAVLLEWDHGMFTTVVELATLNG